MHGMQLSRQRSFTPSTSYVPMARGRCVLVRAEGGNTVPSNVLEAREWIAAWRFQQAKVSSLADAIQQAAAFLEEHKEARQARAAALTRQVNVTFAVKQKVEYGQSIKLVGSSPEFGSWDPTAAPKTTWSEGDVWQVTLALPAGKHEFKVVGVWDSGEPQWEDGDNRFVNVPAGAEKLLFDMEGRLKKAPAAASKKE